MAVDLAKDIVEVACANRAGSRVGDELEEMLGQFEVLYPDEELIRVAIRGAATYGLSWSDAHMWAYAERFRLETLWSEDFEDGRLYGRVRTRDPFIAPP